MTRRGGGARGRAGAPAPSNTHGSPAWHEANRTRLQAQATQLRAGAAQRKATLHPPVHHGGFTCSHCGWGEWHLHRVAAKGGGHHPTLAMQGCAHCGTLHPTSLHLHKTAAAELEDLDPVAAIAKSIDASDTAVQREDLSVGHRSNCPRGGQAPCGKAVDGRCSRCSALVQDHAAIGKTTSDQDLIGQLRKQAGLS